MNNWELSKNRQDYDIKDLKADLISKLKQDNSSNQNIFFFSSTDKRISIDQLIKEIENESEIGLRYIEAFKKIKENYKESINQTKGNSLLEQFRKYLSWILQN